MLYSGQREKISHVFLLFLVTLKVYVFAQVENVFLSADSLLVATDTLVITFPSDDPLRVVTILIRPSEQKQWDTLIWNTANTTFSLIVPYYKNTDSVEIKIVVQKTVPPVLVAELLESHNDEIRSLQFLSGSSSILLSVARDYRARIWDIAQRVVLFELPEDLQRYWQRKEQTEFIGKFFNSADTVVLTVGDVLVLWFPAMQQWIEIPVDTPSIQNDFIRAFDFRGNQLAVGFNSGKVIVGVLKEGKFFETKQLLLNDSLRVYDLRWASREATVIVVGSTGKVYEWSLDSDAVAVYNGRHGIGSAAKVIWSCDLSPDERYILTGGVDRTARLWSRSSRSEYAVFQNSQSHIRVVRFHPLAEEFFYAGLQGLLWQKIGLDTPKAAPWNPMDHRAAILTAAYSHDGTLIATAGRTDHTIRIWRNGAFWQWDTTATFAYRLPLQLRLPQLVQSPEQDIAVPIIITMPPKAYRVADSVFATVTIPVSLLYVYNTTLPGRIMRGAFFDTLRFLYIPTALADTIGWIYARVLHGPPRFDSLFIQLYDLHRYVDRSIDGWILLKDTCWELDSVHYLLNSVSLSVQLRNGYVLYDGEIPFETSFQLRIYDVSGRISAPPRRGIAPIRITGAIDIRHIPSGLYFIELWTPLGSLCYPFWR